MRGKRWKRTLGALILIGTILGSFTSCESRVSEPEQSYLVSAMGFDSSDIGIRVTIEIPVISESKSAEAKTILFSESGASVKEALAHMQRGISRELVFSHCALAVLGEDLDKEQMQEIFAFAQTGESLPLATEVVRSTNAEEILRAGSLSAPAVGYEIPELLKRERKRMGVEMRCSIYELRATASPELPVALPRMETVKEGESTSVRLEGLDVLRAHAEAVRLSADDWIPYAILSDHFTGGSDMTQRIGQVKSSLTTEYDGVSYSLSLNLKISLTGGTDDRAEELQYDICERTEALFAYARDTVGEDLFLLGEQIKRENTEIPLEDLTWIRHAMLTVNCEIDRKG